MLELTDKIFVEWLESAQKVAINRLHPVARDEKFIRIGNVQWGTLRRVGYEEYARINRTTGDITIKEYPDKARGNIYDKSTWRFGPKRIPAYMPKPEVSEEDLEPIIKVPKTKKTEAVKTFFDPTPYEDFELDDL